MARLLIIGASLALLLTTAQAQVMRQHSLVCDLFVEGHRVTWPPFILSNDECVELKATVRKHHDKANLECKCTVGDRA